LIKNILGI